MSVNNYPPCYSWERSFVRPFLKESIATFLGGLSVFLRTRCEHIANTKAHFIAFHLIFTFRVESYKMSMNQRNIIQNKITWNAKKFYSNRLTIWRSQVQAQAGLRFYYSDLCFGVGRCFLFNLTRVVCDVCAGKLTILHKNPRKDICRTFYLIITKIEYYAKHFVKYHYFCCYLFKYLTSILYLCRNS